MSNAPGYDAAIDLDEVRIDTALALRVPESLAVRRRILAFGQDERGVYAACADPEDAVAIESLERALGRPVIPVRAAAAPLGRALARVFARPGEAAADDAVRVVDEIFHAAVLEQASDVHVEPAARGARVRFRVDGVLEEVRALPEGLVPGVVNRLKVLAGMDISERRLPQDGRFTLPAIGGEETIDVRAAALPARFGERITLRLLARRAAELTLARLGLDEHDLAAFRSAVASPHGLVLLTGPTGSGKSTTLYAALRTLDLPRINVLAIEDPVEYDVPGITQVEVDQGDRITFGRALRSMLRHDPDVLMIGEIRDLETAEVAIRAALTGHLVLSTLHTNSAIAAVTRLVDMGVAPYLLAATLRLAVAQRLVRRLCQRCRRARPLVETEAILLGSAAEAGATVFDAGGCGWCKRSGHAGRIGIFETFRPAPEALAAIARGASEAEIRALAGGAIRTLRHDAVAKVLAGVTSAEEGLRAVEGA